MDAELTVGQAAARIGISTSALRFYERAGLISAARSSGNQRRYSRDVLRRVAFIRGAQSVGMKLRDIKAAMDHLPADHAPSKEDWERVSTSWRPLLDERLELIVALRDKLSQCIGCGCQTLDNCEIFNPGDIVANDGPGAHFLR